MNRYKFKFLNQDTKFFIRKYAIGPLMLVISYLTYLLGAFIPWLELDKPIFVIGCSRSGTTLFVDMFARHADLANWSEAPQVFELDYCNPEIDHIKSEQDATPFHTRRIKTLFALYTSLKSKKRFVNKHPENSLRLSFLKTIFPDALFIHIIRDGRAVVRSSYAQTVKETLRQKFPLGWFPKPPGWRAYRDLPVVLQFAHQWVAIVNHIRQVAFETLSTDNYLEISYEHFCKDPHTVLRSVDLFCGLNPDRRQYAEIPPVFHLQNFKWQEQFDAKQIHQIEEILGELLLELNYPGPLETG